MDDPLFFTPFSRRASYAGEACTNEARKLRFLDCIVRGRRELCLFRAYSKVVFETQVEGALVSDFLYHELVNSSSTFNMELMISPVDWKRLALGLEKDQDVMAPETPRL